MRYIQLDEHNNGHTRTAAVSRARAQLLSAIKNQHGGAHSMWYGTIYYIYIYIGVLWRCSPQHRSRQPALKRSRAPAYICSVEPHLLYAVYAQTIFRYTRVFGVVHKSKASSIVCKKYMCEKKRITYIHASIYNIEMKAAMRHHLPTARRGRALIHNYVVGIVVWPDARPTYEWNAIPHNGTQRSYAAIGTSQLRTAQSQSYICYIYLCVWLWYDAFWTISHNMRNNVLGHSGNNEVRRIYIERNAIFCRRISFIRRVIIWWPRRYYITVRTI